MKRSSGSKKSNAHFLTAKEEFMYFLKMCASLRVANMRSYYSVCSLIVFLVYQLFKNWLGSYNLCIHFLALPLPMMSAWACYLTSQSLGFFSYKVRKLNQITCMSHYVSNIL